MRHIQAVKDNKHCEGGGSPSLKQLGGLVVKEKLDAEYLAESLHTALRKCCDSPQTTIAWNAINLLDRNEWHEYLVEVLYALKGKTEEGEITRAVRESSLRCRIAGSYAGNILKSSFKLFADDDWYGYASFLFEFEM